MELAVKTRDILGKKVRFLRREGWLPAELYSRGIANLHLAVLAKELDKLLQSGGESSIITLNIEADSAPNSKQALGHGSGQEQRPVLIQNIQRQPLSGEVSSIDFYQVRMDEKVKLAVPFEFIGEAPAVGEKNGVLVKVMQAVEVEALPADIPSLIKLDLAPLVEIGQSLQIKDLELVSFEAKNVKILAEPESVIVTVKARMTEEEEKELEGKLADVSKVEVAGEKKAEETAAVEQDTPVKAGENKKENKAS